MPTSKPRVRASRSKAAIAARAKAKAKKQEQQAAEEARRAEKRAALNELRAAEEAKRAGPWPEPIPATGLSEFAAMCRDSTEAQAAAAADPVQVPEPAADAVAPRPPSVSVQDEFTKFLKSRVGMDCMDVRLPSGLARVHCILQDRLHRAFVAGYNTHFTNQ